MIFGTVIVQCRQLDKRIVSKQTLDKGEKNETNNKNNHQKRKEHQG